MSASSWTGDTIARPINKSTSETEFTAKKQ